MEKEINKIEKVGFRTIGETIEGVSQRILSLKNISENTRETLERIDQFKKGMAQEQYAPEFNRERFFGCLNSYIKELKDVINNDAMWSELPDFIPPDEISLEMAKNTLTMLNDPNEYSRGMTEDEIIAAQETDREMVSKKMRGDQKEEVRNKMREYVQELSDLLLEGTSSKTDVMQ